jgi:hypothetical protein
MAFGHSALRVKDPVKRIDVVYNYGTFDFEKPNFIPNYIKGRPIFSLAISSYRSFVHVYDQENRSVVEDILQLNQQQKQQLFDLLQENLENPDYTYDYIKDNCSTRIRDILTEMMKGALVFDTTQRNPVYSFRQLMDLYLKPQPWGDFGIDLALSSVIDTPTTPYHYMFLPDFLQQEFQHARIVTDTSSVPLVRETIVLLDIAPEEQKPGLFTPFNLFWLCFTLFFVLTLFQLPKKEVTFAFDVAWFALIGLTGILIFSFLLPFAKKLRWVRYYFLASLVVTSIAFVGGLTFIPQQFNTAFYPIMLVLMMRSWLISRKITPGHVAS